MRRHSASSGWSRTLTSHFSMEFSRPRKSFIRPLNTDCNGCHEGSVLTMWIKMAEDWPYWAVGMWNDHRLWPYCWLDWNYNRRKISLHQAWTKHMPFLRDWEQLLWATLDEWCPVITWLSQWKPTFSLRASIDTDSPNFAKHSSDSYIFAVASGDKEKLRIAIAADIHISSRGCFPCGLARREKTRSNKASRRHLARPFQVDTQLKHHINPHCITFKVTRKIKESGEFTTAVSCG